MIEPISFGLCLWLFARWAKRKMEESGSSPERQEALLAMHKKHGIRFEDASGTIHVFDQEGQSPGRDWGEERPSVVVDARSIHVHYHYRPSGGDQRR